MRTLIAHFLALIGMLSAPEAGALPPASFTPEQIIAEKRLDLLRDEPYYHPVRPDTLTGEIYVQLRKWDLIFTGPLPEHAGNINNIIPGRYDHTIAYVGKDERGYAYFVEINVNSLIDREGIRLFSPGTDFGDVLHPSGLRFWSDYAIEYRWAKTFRDEVRTRVLASDAALTRQLISDLNQKLPYQMPAGIGPNPLVRREILLVDDGMDGGASCSDYWTTLFEEHASTCFYGVRFSKEDFIDYVLNDPAGRAAYIPDEVNPLPRRLTGAQLLGLGFSVVEDEPHVFSCGGEPESGLVLAELIMDSPLLIDPPVVIAPEDPRHLSDAIEYYNPGIDRYLITNAAEASLIDAGNAGPGWERTGENFKTWSLPRGGAVAVNRFFASASTAHFLTLSPVERDALLLLNPSNEARDDAWILEGITFYLRAPVDGTCPEGTLNVHRVYKQIKNGGPAHRYSIDTKTINAMTSIGWEDEGVVMCAPH